MNIEIANRLVRLRKQHGYSQEELAAKIGLSRQAVSKWERAEASPDTDNLILLSRVYGISLDELLRTEDKTDELLQAEQDLPKPPKSSHFGISLIINGRKSDPIEEGGAADAPNAAKAAKSRRNKRIDDIVVALVLLLYPILGFVWNLWHPGWLVVFLVPLVVPVVDWFYGEKRTMRGFFAEFPYAVLVVAVFLLLGFVWGLWHPAWVLFLTIPLYHVIF